MARDKIGADISQTIDQTLNVGNRKIRVRPHLKMSLRQSSGPGSVLAIWSTLVMNGKSTPINGGATSPNGDIRPRRRVGKRRGSNSPGTQAHGRQFESGAQFILVVWDIPDRRESAIAVSGDRPRVVGGAGIVIAIAAKVQHLKHDGFAGGKAAAGDKDGVAGGIITFVSCDLGRRHRCLAEQTQGQDCYQAPQKKPGPKGYSRRFGPMLFVHYVHKMPLRVCQKLWF